MSLWGRRQAPQLCAISKLHLVRASEGDRLGAGTQVETGLQAQSTTDLPLACSRGGTREEGGGGRGPGWLGWQGCTAWCRPLSDPFRPPDLVQDINAGWTLLSGYLVFFMQCGFAMLCAGAVRAKNAKNIILLNILDSCFGAMAWYITGGLPLAPLGCCSTTHHHRPRLLASAGYTLLLDCRLVNGESLHVCMAGRQAGIGSGRGNVPCLWQREILFVNGLHSNKLAAVHVCRLCLCFWRPCR